MPTLSQQYCDPASFVLQAKERIEMAKIRVRELEAQNKRDEIKLKKEELSMKLNNERRV